jgi:hypothetical protein
MSEAVKVIDKLRAAGHTFYLGGSRRMAELHPTHVQITPTTDHDFYATYSDALEALIRSDQDFQITGDPATDPYPYDTEVVKIVQHLDLNLQIVLRKDAEFYRSVFEAIPPEYYTKYLWKSSPSCPDRNFIMPTFDTLFAIAHAQLAIPASSSVSPTHTTPSDPLKAYEYAMKGII